MLDPQQPDIFIATETHLTSNVLSTEVLPPAYSGQTHCSDCGVGERWGGVLMASHEETIFTPLPDDSASESAWAKIDTCSKPIII